MAQPAQDDEDSAPEAPGYLLAEPVPLAPRLAEYGAAGAMFAAFVWARDVPMGAVAGIGTFVAVVLLANALFSRLAGIHRLRFRITQPDGTPGRISSRWTPYSQAALFGAFLAGVADFAHDFVAGIGVGGSALAGFLVALVYSGWRQRWSERRLYRETLFTA